MPIKTEEELTLYAINVVKKLEPVDIKKVIFNDPATIVIWADGTKTIVKCDRYDIYNKTTGLLLCLVKKMFGNTSKYNDVLREWLP